jgi:ABC-type phosphate/phosphonate transport system substrate-binding protein
VVAPDPATLAPDEFDLHALWLHPALLVAQTCWGPMGQGLAAHVQVVGQPDYSAFEGGEGELYSSAIVMRGRNSVAASGKPDIPLGLLRGKHFIYNSPDSMSGILALAQDLEAVGETLDVFSERGLSGGHRASIIAVADGRADIAAIDCRSWAMAQFFEPKAKELAAVGWTARRKGLPFIAAGATPVDVVAALSDVLRS